ncbi:hypothetical protein ACFYOA_37240 [Streptomyces iakyrus]|uniref:hypothetical protein n=1 Tax=Streptomyces iakyrus TaxID=68219 RepID=UPI0036884AAA
MPGTPRHGTPKSVGPCCHAPSAIARWCGGPETRSYSLVDRGRDDGLLRIAVRLQRDGRGGSRWMHGLRPGSEITFAGPIDEFPPSPGRLPSVLLAGSIGITPIVGLARALRSRGADCRLVYAGRSRDEMAFAGDLEQEHPGRLTIVEDRHGTFVDPDEVVASVPEGACCTSAARSGCSPLFERRASGQPGRRVNSASRRSERAAPLPRKPSACRFPRAA